jgi:hypothetical protein
MAEWRGRAQALMLSGSSQPLGRRSTPALGAEQVSQTLAGFEEYAAAGTLLVLELVGPFVFALTLETPIDRRATAAPISSRLATSDLGSK